MLMNLIRSSLIDVLYDIFVCHLRTKSHYHIISAFLLKMLNQRKKPRRHDYIDHDRVDEEGGGRWPSYQGGPDNDGYYHSSRKGRDAHDYYYNGGDSPPGLYDSPSEDSDDE